VFVLLLLSASSLRRTSSSIQALFSSMMEGLIKIKIGGHVLKSRHDLLLPLKFGIHLPLPYLNFFLILEK
jgi:hypothetical protein